MNLRVIKATFLTSAVYDAVLGLGFLFVPTVIFNLFDVTPPNHLAYVQFPALLLIVFAYMFYQIAKNPESRRELMVYGMFLKLSYSGVTLGYHFTQHIPAMWIPMAYIDLAFFALFFLAWKKTAPSVPLSHISR